MSVPLPQHQIPEPISRAGPTAVELRREDLFLSDFDSGFVTRGVTAAVAQRIRDCRDALISDIRSALCEFVADVTERKLQQRLLVAAGSAATSNTNTTAAAAPNTPNTPSLSSQQQTQQQQQQQQPSLSFGVDVLPTNALPMSRWADVRPYGSVAVGADLADSDVDLVCLAPSHVSRADFMSNFPAVLTRHISVTTKRFTISNLVVIRAAKVPVISFTATSTTSSSSSSSPEPSSRRRQREQPQQQQQDQGQEPLLHNFATEVDLIFVGIHTQQQAVQQQLAGEPPSNEELADPVAMMRLVAPEYRLSVNGVRTALEMRRLNPCAAAPRAFRVVACAVKTWAALRGVAGNNFCFPGGVAWAVLVTRMMQNYPNECCVGLLRKFFIYWGHVWLKNVADVVASTNGASSNNSSSATNKAIMAVKLTKELNAYPQLGRVGGMPDTWQQPPVTAGTSASASTDLFPVLNPAFPHLNTTHTLTMSTVTALAREFVRAADIMQQGLGAQSEAGSGGGPDGGDGSGDMLRPWRALMSTPYRIVDEYRVFIVVEASAVPGMLAMESEGSNEAPAADQQQQRYSRAFLEWSRFVESRLKILLYALDSSGAVDCRPVCAVFRGDDLDASCLPPRQVPPQWIEFQQQQQQQKREAAAAATPVVVASPPPSTSRYIPPSKRDSAAAAAAAAAAAQREESVQTVVRPDCRSFLVVGVRSTAAAVNTSGGGADADEVVRIAPSLRSALDEFRFSVSSEAQGGGTSPLAFRHADAMLPPEISVVQLRRRGVGDESDGVPAVDEAASRMNCNHSAALVRELLRRSVPSTTLSIDHAQAPRRCRE